ncbi:MAG: leucine-rich repeat domain-containing protein [Flavobacteriales bacterium]|nr:leucine-rich repeat domain-containing protein [Flavobacteriales bacterium]
MLLLFGVCAPGRASTYIPDVNFRNWLMANYPAAMSGSYLDETHPDVVNTTFLDISNQNIADITGLDAFQNVVILDIRNNQITGSLYPPAFLEYLFCSYNQLSHVEVPFLAREVRADHNQITGAFDIGFGSDLYLLDCSFNQITELTGGDLGQLDLIDASHNQITQLVPVNWNNAPDLHDFSHNLITEVTQFGADALDISYNLIDSIGVLYDVSSVSRTVDLSGNPLSHGIGGLNSELEWLVIDSSQIACLPRLPLAMTDLFCRGTNVGCLPNVPPGLDTDPARFDFAPVECLPADPCYSPDPRVHVGLFLDGPFDKVSGLMHDSLRARGLLPLSEPYTALGYGYVGSSAAGATIPPSLLAVSGNDAIVDWVIVELRDGNSANSNTVCSVPALVQRDGDVVDTTGTSVLEFVGVEWGDYFVAVRHRNHLGLVPLTIHAFGGEVEAIDFRNDGLTACFPNAALIDYQNGGRQTMWCGDATWNKQVAYTGAGNDRDPVLVAIGGLAPTQVVDGIYAQEDVNMDGIIKYAGAANDRDRILQTIGGAQPTAVRSQVPQF